MNDNPQSEVPRDVIIREAIRVFSEKGFRGAKAEELAAAVGIPEADIRAQFPTRNDFCDAILDTMANNGFENLTALLDVHLHAEDDRSFFLGLANAIVEWFLRDPEFVRVLLFSSLEGDELGRRFHERVRDSIATVIARYAEQRKSFREIDPEILAHLILCAMAHHGLLEVVVGHRLSKNPDEVIECMVDLLMGGICKR